MLTQVRDQLRSLPQVAFVEGDSSAHQSKTLLTFVQELDDLIALKRPFTFILDDPLANVYIQNLRAHNPAPDNVDIQLEREEYTRTAEQDEELSISSCNPKH